jgi:hypothetical protein
MTVVVGRLFLDCRPNIDSPWAAVVAYVIDRGVIDDHRLVVHVPDVGDVSHVIHRSVVEEALIIPITALITRTNIAEAVVNATVKSNMRAPISLVKYIDAISPSPIPGRP